MLSLGSSGFDLLNDGLRLLAAQRFPDGGQQLLLFIPDVALEDLTKFGQLRRELRIGLGDPVQIGQELPDLLVVVDRVGDQTLGFRMFAQNRKKMLFLKAGEGLQLILEFREQLFPGLDRAVRCVGNVEKLGVPATVSPLKPKPSLAPKSL